MISNNGGIAKADQTAAEAGTSDSVWMSPLKVQQALNALTNVVADTYSERVNAIGSVGGGTQDLALTSGEPSWRWVDFCLDWHPETSNRPLTIRHNEVFFIVANFKPLGCQRQFVALFVFVDQLNRRSRSSRERLRNGD